MPCSYCGRKGCGTETCPERLETYHGVPEDGLETDGGTAEVEERLHDAWNTITSEVRDGGTGDGEGGEGS